MFGLLRRLISRLFSYFAPPDLVTIGEAPSTRAGVRRVGDIFRTPAGDPARPRVWGFDAVERPSDGEPYVRWSEHRARIETIPAGREASLRKLRRAAVLDILDQLGVGVAPSACWIYTDEDDDVARGLARFFSALGIDPAGIQAHDSIELTRANELFELLVDVQQSFGRLDASVVDRIAERVLSGDYDKVRETARAVAAMEKLARTAEAWPPERRLALLNELVDEVKDSLRDPLTLSPAEIAEAEGAIGGLIALMVKFDAAQMTFAAVTQTLAREWPSEWTISLEADDLRREMSTAETLQDLLRHQRGSGPADVNAALEELEAINLRLEELLRRVHTHKGRSAGAGSSSKSSGHTSGGARSSGKRGGSRRGKGGAGSGSGGAGSRTGTGRAGAAPGTMSRRDEALVFFGFAAGSKPSEEQMKKAYRAFLFKNHPDFGPAHEQAKRTAITQKGIEFKTYLGL